MLDLVRMYALEGVILCCIIIGIIAIHVKHLESEVEAKILNSERNIKQDYEKTLAVVDSCKTLEQLNVARQMLEIFKKKHEVNESSCKPFSTILLAAVEKKEGELS